MEVYAECRMCGKMVKRGDMRAATITLFGKGVAEIEDKIKLRMCPDCWAAQVSHWKRCRWNPRSLVITKKEEGSHG